MRRLATLLVVLASLMPAAAAAAPGGGAGPGNGGPGGNGPAAPGPGGGGPAAPGPQANGTGQNNGHGPGQNNGNGPGENNGKGPGKGDDPGVPPAAPGASDQTVARDALEVGSTLPLTAIVKAAISADGGRLIDAQLFIINKTPIYRLTLIDRRGVTRRVYYDARTAKPIGPP